ncbi:hypothetical protein U1Q18_052167 [Sarracenia purpurea var. burkii]
MPQPHSSYLKDIFEAACAIPDIAQSRPRIENWKHWPRKDWQRDHSIMWQVVRAVGASWRLSLMLSDWRMVPEMLSGTAIDTFNRGLGVMLIEKHFFVHNICATCDRIAENAVIKQQIHVGISTFTKLGPVGTVVSLHIWDVAQNGNVVAWSAGCAPKIGDCVLDTKDLAQHCIVEQIQPAAIIDPKGHMRANRWRSFPGSNSKEPCLPS